MFPYQYLDFTSGSPFLKKFQETVEIIFIGCEKLTLELELFVFASHLSIYR